MFEGGLVVRGIEKVMNCLSRYPNVSRARRRQLQLVRSLKCLQRSCAACRESNLQGSRLNLKGLNPYFFDFGRNVSTGRKFTRSPTRSTIINKQKLGPPTLTHPAQPFTHLQRLPSSFINGQNLYKAEDLLDSVMKASPQFPVSSSPGSPVSFHIIFL